MNGMKILYLIIFGLLVFIYYLGRTTESHAADRPARSSSTDRNKPVYVGEGRYACYGDSASCREFQGEQRAADARSEQIRRSHDDASTQPQSVIDRIDRLLKENR